MDFCRNVAVSGDEYLQDQVLSSSSIPPSSSSSSNLALANPLDDLFTAHTTEVDVSLEWLSIFVEDCLSSSGICLPASELPTKSNATTPTAAPTPKPLKQQQQQQRQTTSTTTTLSPPPSLEKFVVPGKARSKRKRASSTATATSRLTQTSRSLSSLTTSCWTTTHNNSLADTQLFHSDDPPLLQVQQAFWLADSQLILPKKETTNTNSNKKVKPNDDDDDDEEEEEEEAKEEDTDIGKEVEAVQQQQQQQQGRRCSHCLSQRTPQWRAGPLGPKTLCNACGVRYKSGRLLPEYRPAKSPTFVSYLHSNSHKKVLEMRMALMPSPSSLPK